MGSGKTVDRPRARGGTGNHAADVRGGKDRVVRGDDQDRATGETRERISIGELRPDDRGQDEVREALEESIGEGEPRPLTREEREAAAHHSGPPRTTYAPGSERLAKAPLPADEQLINVEARLSAPITSDDHAQGPIHATVTLVQYGDYECPYTRMSRHSVHQLQRQYPETLRFVFRHFPLAEIHPHARAAAMAAEAAGAQADFWTMHEYLFEHQKALAESDLRTYALELRLDADRFERDRRSSQVIERVERDLASGEASGVQGTPTFFVNGTRHDGAYDLESLRSAVVGQLRSASEHQDDSA